MLFVLLTLLQLAVLPALLLFWQAFGKPQSLLLWGLKTLSIGLFVLAMYQVAAWYVLSYYGRYLLLLLYGAAVLYSGYRIRNEPLWHRPRGRHWLAPAAAVLLLLVAGLWLAFAVEARQVPTEPVELSFPLRDGRYYVAQGGSHPLVNPHMKVADPSLEAWRGQLWALDIVELFPSGNRAHGLYPKDPRAYAIFDAPVYAPCTGRVASMRDSLPDLIPPYADTQNKTGNYVLLQCQKGAFVLLAHLKQHSITIRRGQQVRIGEPLGRVGNSGNTSEPHLHLSAQRSEGGTTILDADPLPMLFDGYFPIRNAVF